MYITLEELLYLIFILQYKHIYKALVVKLEYYMQEICPKETMKLLHVKATVVERFLRTIHNEVWTYVCVQEALFMNNLCLCLYSSCKLLHAKVGTKK